MVDVRRKTCLIIRRRNEFLVGRILFSSELRWSISLYDAWRTREKDSAKKLARVVGGDLYLFNPAIGEIRRFEGASESAE